MSKKTFIPRCVRGVDEVGEVLVGAEVRVDLGEVGDPVAVVAGGRAVLELHRLVLEDRRQPDRVGAEPLDVVEPRAQAVEVAAVVEPLVGRVEAGHVRVAGQPAGVVGGVGVREPVAHHEVEVLVAEAGTWCMNGVAAVVGWRRAGGCGETEGHGEDERADDGYSEQQAHGFSREVTWITRLLQPRRPHRQRQGLGAAGRDTEAERSGCSISRWRGTACPRHRGRAIGR